MGLREQVIADRHIFFDLDAFATWHTFAGRRVLCIVDNEQALQETVKAGGIYAGEAVVFLREEDAAGLQLAPEAQVTMDGKSCTVQSANPIDGIVEVRLYQRRAY